MGNSRDDAQPESIALKQQNSPPAYTAVAGPSGNPEAGGEPRDKINVLPIHLFDKPRRYYCHDCKKDVTTKTTKTIGSNGVICGIGSCAIAACCSCCCIAPIIFLIFGFRIFNENFDWEAFEDLNERLIADGKMEETRPITDFYDENGKFNKTAYMQYSEKLQGVYNDTEVAKYLEEHVVDVDGFEEDIEGLSGDLIIAFLICGFVILIALVVPIMTKKNVEHKCPECSKKVGVYRPKIGMK